MIRGEKIYLTELDVDNAETIRAWLNDPEVYKYLLSATPPSPGRTSNGTTRRTPCRRTPRASRSMWPEDCALRRQRRTQGHRPRAPARRTGDRDRP